MKRGSVVVLLAVLVGLAALLSFSPPPSATRKAAFSREAEQETLVNPQFSSGLANRFLYALGPNDLLAAGGGTSFADPARHGYDAKSTLPPLWLTHGGRVEWPERDLTVRGVGLPLAFDRIFRGSVSSSAGPLGSRWGIRSPPP